ncbi:hypothetical protein SELMODRAFT_438289 [Selaginella moellendorffii]|uniref:Uncharacterized protein n=1 Tax=Selaginella moellendorffii TaxID=88036 RepID=D8QVR7_SELML|nr:hypothetical protein SELMODRAFT_438289 [Selaginella moellendorffii]
MPQPVLLKRSDFRWNFPKEIVVAYPIHPSQHLPARQTKCILTEPGVLWFAIIGICRVWQPVKFLDFGSSRSYTECKENGEERKKKVIHSCRREAKSCKACKHS